MKGRSGGFELSHLGVANVPAEAIVQGAFLNASAITEAIREAIDNGKIKTKNVAAAVSGHSVIVKKVSLPAMSREELDEQIRWEAEQYIPFDVNEVNLDFQILGGGNDEGQMEVLLVAAKKDLIDDYVQVIHEAGLVPVAIDVAAFAVENAFEANYDGSRERDRGARQRRRPGREHQHRLERAFRASRATSRPRATSTPKRSRRRSRSASDEAERIKLGGRRTDSQDVVPQEVEQAVQSVTETVIGEISRSLDFYGATSADSADREGLPRGRRVEGVRASRRRSTSAPASRWPR